MMQEFKLRNEEDREKTHSSFLKQSGVIYRKMLSEMKRKAMAYAGITTPDELYHAPRPPYIRTDELWHQFVKHWNSPNQLRKSKQNKENRNKLKGASHGYGRKGLAQRLHDMREAGEDPSVVKAMTDANTVKDSKNQPTDRVYNPNIRDNLIDYRNQYKEVHGHEADVEKDPFDVRMWTGLPEVARRTKTGRVLGMGSATNTHTYINPEASSSSGPSYHAFRCELDEMRLEREEERRKQREAQEQYDRQWAAQLQQREVEQAERFQQELGQRDSIITNMAFEIVAMKQMIEQLRTSFAQHSIPVMPGVVFHEVQQTPGVPPPTQPEPIEEENDDDSSGSGGEDDEEFIDASDG